MTILDLPVTIFLGGVSNADDPMHATLATVRDMVAGEHPDPDLARYCLRAAQNNDAGAYESSKKRLPIAVFGGHFSYRRADRCVKYSGLVVIDLDDIDEPQALRDTLAGDEHCAACFLSPSGSGLKPVFLTAATSADEHARAWASVMAYLRDAYNIEAGTSKSQHDVCRACFLGIDAGVCLNPNAVPLPLSADVELPKPATPPAPASEGARMVRPNERHQYLIAYCARLASIGLPEREILRAAETLIADRFDLSDGRTFADAEISDAVRSGLRKYRGEDQIQQLVDGKAAADAILGSAEPEPVRPLVVRTHADRIRDHLIPPPQLVAGMLPAIGVGAIIGPPGCGKSMIAVELARCIASGSRFGNAACQRRRVLYVCSDAPDSTERRFIAMDERARDGILTVPSAPRLPAGLAEYELALDAHDGIGLLILDTWDSSRQHAAGGYAEQDGATDDLMATLRDVAKRRSLCVVIIHHSTKQDSTQARGTMVFDARADWMGSVTRENEVNLILSTTKARDGERGQVGAWRIESRPHPDAPDAPAVPFLRLLTGDEQAEGSACDQAAKVAERRRKAAAMAEAGASVRDIAGKLGISPSTAAADLRAMRQEGP